MNYDIFEFIDSLGAAVRTDIVCIIEIPIMIIKL